MQTYSQFRPTGFDPAGAFLEDDRQDWLVLPVSQTRDSGPFDHSNFAAALEMLGGESDTVEVHRFGHWGPGWFEIIIVQPGTPAATIAEDIESRLEDYPLLDESDYSQREFEEFEESWDSWGRKQLVKDIVKGFGLSERAADLLDDADNETLRQWWMSGANFPYEPDGDGVTIPTGRVDDWFSRDQVAQLLRSLRAVPA